MKCPKCKGNCTVKDTRPNKNDPAETFRKQLCKNCGNEFFTVEYPIIENNRFKKDYSESTRK